MNLSKHTDVTQEELDQMKLHHRKTDYTNEEQMTVYNLVKKYVNQHIQPCLSCNNKLREAKNQLNSFYLMYVDQIQARLDAKTQMSEASQQVSDYIKENATPAKKKPVKKKK